MKEDYNIYKLSGVPVSDEKVLELYGMSDDLAHTPEMNFKIIEEARQQELLDFPDEEDLINQKYDRMVTNLKVKLASKGLLK